MNVAVDHLNLEVALELRVWHNFCFDEPPRALISSVISIQTTKNDKTSLPQEHEV